MDSNAKIAVEQSGGSPIVVTESIRAENLEFWNDFVCPTLLEGECSGPSGKAFHGNVSMTRLSEISFVQVRSVGQRFERTSRWIARSQFELIPAMLQIAGSGVISQDGRDVRLHEGDFTFVDSTRPFTLSFAEDYEQLVVHVPRDLVEKALGPTQRITTQLCQAETPLASIVGQYLRHASSILNRAKMSSIQPLSDIGLSLIMTTLGELAARPAEHSGWARTTLLFRAQVFINAHSRDHLLNSGTVACALRISPRYLQELFRAEGTTPSEYIWRSRLKKCEEDFLNPALAAMNISEIALRCGFQDFAHFSHRFKAAFQMSAREFRFQAREKETWRHPRSLPSR